MREEVRFINLSCGVSEQGLRQVDLILSMQAHLRCSEFHQFAIDSVSNEGVELT